MDVSAIKEEPYGLFEDDSEMHPFLFPLKMDPDISDVKIEGQLFDEYDTYNDLNPVAEPITTNNQTLEENISVISNHLSKTKKALICSFCNKQFCHRSSLSRHRKLFHKNPLSNQMPNTFSLIPETAATIIEQLPDLQQHTPIMPNMIPCTADNSPIFFPQMINPSLPLHYSQSVKTTPNSFIGDNLCFSDDPSVCHYSIERPDKSMDVYDHNYSEQNLHSTFSENAFSSELSDKQSSYRCTTCDKQFQHSSSLSRHKQICQNSFNFGQISSVSCVDEMKFSPFSSANLNDTANDDLVIGEQCSPHFDSETNQRFEPGVIAADISDENSYVNFSESDFSLSFHCDKLPSVASLMCSFCGKHFRHRSSLSRHKMQFHKKLHQLSSISLEETNTNRDGSQTQISIHECFRCGGIFSTEFLLKKHILTYHEDELSSLFKHRKNRLVDMEYKCESCNETFSSRRILRQHTRLAHSNSELLYCQVCGRRFSSPYYLIRHQKIHERKMYCCNQCDRKFTYYSILKEHQISHSKDRPFSCQICNKAFKRKSVLFNHELIHNEKKHECSFCQKRFTQIGHLRRHEKMHSTEMMMLVQGSLHDDSNVHPPCSCNVCGKCFCNTATLAKHTETHSHEKPFACTVCGKTFKTAEYLKEHSKFHSAIKPCQCQYCGKRFVKSSDMRRHERIHTGEKPFGCQYCGHRFNQHNSLVVHNRIHTGEKPFGCQQCDKRFKRSDSLRKHTTLHLKPKTISKRFRKLLQTAADS